MKKRCVGVLNVAQRILIMYVGNCIPALGWVSEWRSPEVINLLQVESRQWSATLEKLAW